MVQIQLDGGNPRAPVFQPHGSFTRGTEAGCLFHPRVNNDLHAFAGHAGLHGLLCLREAMAEQTLSREGILVAQHHFHHGFVFIVRVVRHADDTQVARADLVHVDAGLAAVHEVARLEIHAGFAEIHIHIVYVYDFPLLSRYINLFSAAENRTAPIARSKLICHNSITKKRVWHKK